MVKGLSQMMGLFDSSIAVTDHDIARAEQSLYRVQQDLAVKKDLPVPAKSWVGRIFAPGQTAEVDGLKAMERQMARSLKVLRKRKVRSIKVDLLAKTRVGKNSRKVY